MKVLILTLLLFVTSHASALCAMTDSTASLGGHKHDAFYLELGGQGFFLSMNYERAFKTGFALKAGVSAIPGMLTDDISVLANAMLIYLGSANTSDHHIELGIGASTALVGYTKEDVYLSGAIGYRYQNPGGGTIYKVAFTPIFSSDGITPWASIGIGENF